MWNHSSSLEGYSILLQKMEQDTVTPSGPPVKILDQPNEDGQLAEALALMRPDEGIYFLFFRSGCARFPTYDVKYATNSNITEPCTRASKELLKSGDMGLLAPGSVSVGRDGKTWCLTFHTRVITDWGRSRDVYGKADFERH
ncbi:glycoside hydrolase family 43 protein [Zopfia rhizophila CBS 207.26]|uniref:Glycoside hydrolase family 43 protein n=1 Tax=Zopfia rhizophila CBS 207.26 TaxID=1314779 RepID=A0A6A6DTH1_9PEZI|nr:glycoside hydrolase family 43 protein [Zopfia rhizophila CBS 207.26]